MRFVHFSDVHLDKSLMGKRCPETGLPLRVVDIYNNLKLVVDTALEEQVDLVLFCGDMYESYAVKQKYKSLVHKQIMRLSREGIPTVLLVGNHDRIKSELSRHALDEFRSLEVENIYVAEKPSTIRIKGVDIACVPWSYEPLDEIPQGDIVACHATLRQSIYDSGAEPSGEILLGKDFILDAADLKGEYIAMGHIHKYQVLSDDPPIIYPGSAEALTWGELGEHNFIIAVLGNSWEKRPYKQRPRHDLYLKANSVDDVYDQLPEIDPEAYYRLTIDWQETRHILNLRQFNGCFDFTLRQNSPLTKRSRLDYMDENASPTETLERYFESIDVDFEDVRELWNDISEQVL